MSFLLDTDVTSQVTKPRPDEGAMRWLSLADLSACYLSVITLFEISEGVSAMPAGKKQRGLDMWLRETLPEQFGRRILPVSAEIAIEAGRLMAGVQTAGFEVDAPDALIAATARVHGLSVVTLNRKHFERLAVPLVTF